MINNLTKAYSISKTLRFELKAIGKTLDNLEKVREKDEKRSTLFKNVKSHADEYHKKFIEEVLREIKLDLKNYSELWPKKNDNAKEFKNSQNELRKIIVQNFSKDPRYKEIFKETLIKKHLPEFYKNDKDKLKEIEEFKNFTSYFTGYHKNRKNMYSPAEKHTAISHRIVNENLKFFMENIDKFSKFPEELKKELKNSVKGFENIEDIEFFNNCISQEGVDKYNEIICGKSLETGEKIKGANEIINEDCQNNKQKHPRLHKLQKQILSDIESSSFKYDVISDNKELYESIDEYYKEFKEIVIGQKESLLNLFSSKEEFDFNKVYLNASDLSYLSNNIFEDYSYIKEALKKDKNLKKVVTFLDKNEDGETQKINPSISLQAISDCFLDDDQFFEGLTLKQKIFNQIEEEYKKLKKPSDETKKLDDTQIESIKSFLDNIKEISDFVKRLIPKDDTLEKDQAFYAILESGIYDILKKIIPLYNKVRNFVTKKPYSLEKFKLNFDATKLFAGWDKNKESDNLGIIFRKGKMYYLGVINKKHKKIFDDSILEKQDNETDVYEKMECKYFPDISQMLPKCALLKKVKEHFKKENTDYILKTDKFTKPLIITKEIYDIYTQEKFTIEYKKIDEDDFKKSLKLWVKFGKEFLGAYKSTSSYDFSGIGEDFKDVSEFYKEVDNITYKISFKNISSKYIDKLVESEKLYLFQIYNKDFSEHSKGTPNLHTMYWNALFDEDNLKDVVYKLNGEAEMFFRKKSIENKEITHPKNEPIQNKNPDNTKKESTFEYDLIKNKRFTEDKIQFHVPITMNFKSKENKPDIINKPVIENIKSNIDDIRIIGIDRGERNLIYISVIDSKQNIIAQRSLNVITNEIKTDYQKLLKNKSTERTEAKKNWKTIQNIKELKAGYLSQVVHEIVKLVREYNAIIILENLNIGFKNSRIKIEKAVYQKFEKMLIEKLNYLVFKNVKDKTAPGGILNAYQLSNPLAKNVKQSGIVFYVNPWSTSKIDPVTGFVNLFQTKYKSVGKSKEFIGKFEKISFNGEYFEFSVKDYSKFTDKCKGTRKDWCICSYGTRIKKKEENKWKSEEIDLTKKFKALFETYNIDYDINSDLKESILNKTETEFFKGFMYCFELMLQMRNSDESQDYIISPARDKNGDFFDSRNKDEQLPVDADANGAYNIARKGLMIINRIKKLKKKTIKRLIALLKIKIG